MYDSYSTPDHLEGPRWCPACLVVLRPHEHNGIELDYCPQCQGIWLDRGQLDLLIRNAIQINSVESNIGLSKNGGLSRRFVTKPLIAADAVFEEELATTCR